MDLNSYHLQGSQVFLPPQVSLHLRTHCGEHVVGVHNYVDESIQ